MLTASKFLLRWERKLTGVMVAQVCGCAKTHSAVYFKGVNIIVNKLQFNKAVIFLKNNSAQPVSILSGL